MNWKTHLWINAVSRLSVFFELLHSCIVNEILCSLSCLRSIRSFILSLEILLNLNGGYIMPLAMMLVYCWRILFTLCEVVLESICIIYLSIGLGQFVFSVNCLALYYLFSSSNLLLTTSLTFFGWSYISIIHWLVVLCKALHWITVYTSIFCFPVLSCFLFELFLRWHPAVFPIPFFTIRREIINGYSAFD